MKFPVLQVALDFVDLSRAIKAAKEAVNGGVDWVEAGTPLIKSEGLDAVRVLRKQFPGRTIVADMKIMDAGRTEVECAAKAGADIVTVLGAATDSTIKECVDAGKNYGAKIEADLIAIDNPVSRAKQLEALGVDIIGVHCSIDEQMEGKEQFETLKEISKIVKIPLALAGGLNSENISTGIKSGARIAIVGGAITKSADPSGAAKALKKAITTKRKVYSKLFKRGGEKDILSILSSVSTSNISDAMHRTGDVAGVAPLFKGIKMMGKAVTVRTYPGDWAKPVQAVDMAQPGDVIVIDAGGVGPAVWGELATHGAMQKKIAGVVIDGACRDSVEIKKLKFPVFSKFVMPRAGEPKGFGEINVPVTIGTTKIFPGDWIVGDDDGICVIPFQKAVEIANRAMHILEYEIRVRHEIDEGSTLAQITELLRWEKIK